MTPPPTPPAFDSSLAGHRVLLTRPRGQNAIWAEALRAGGAHVFVQPVLRLAPPENPGLLSRALTQLASFHWVVITSPNGARAFAAQLAADQAWDWEHLMAGQIETKNFNLSAALRRSSGGGRPLFCAVGPGTAATLKRFGLPVDLVPEEPVGAAIPQALHRHLVAAGRPGLQGQKLLLPQSHRANPALKAALKELGARVTVVPAYQTLTWEAGAAEAGRILMTGRAHMVVFASPSAVQALAEAIVGGKAAGKAFGVVNIGPVTAAAWQRAEKALSLAAGSVATAPEPTAAGIKIACREVGSGLGL